MDESECIYLRCFYNCWHMKSWKFCLFVRGVKYGKDNVNKITSIKYAIGRRQEGHYMIDFNILRKHIVLREHLR